MKWCFVCTGDSPKDATFCIHCSAPFRTAVTNETINLKKIDRWVYWVTAIQFGTMLGLVQFTVIVIGDWLLMTSGVEESFLLMNLAELMVISVLRGMIDTGISLMILVGILRLTEMLVSWGNPVQMAQRRLALMFMLTGVFLLVGRQIAPFNQYGTHDRVYAMVITAGIGQIATVFAALTLWQGRKNSMP